MPIPHDGLGEAINDRLQTRRRAADVICDCNIQCRKQDSAMNTVPSVARTIPAPLLPPDLLARFIAIVGERNAITDPADQEPYLTEQRGLYHGHTQVVLRPGSTAEVSAILKLANETATAIVPQGGNTGLVGGQTPHNGEVVLSLARMDKFREIDPASNTMTCEAGVVLIKAQQAAADVDRLFPLSLGAEGSCTIGGNLSTNAGGTGALAYGVARDLVLGLEVVLADGRIMRGLNKLKKDNTGYDLRHLFLGAEGTLGIITAAVLKLFPRPRAVETAFVGLPSPKAALDLLNLVQTRTGGGATSFELMARLGIEMAIKHGTAMRDPLPGKHPWYVLLQLSSQSREGLRATMETVLAEAAEQGSGRGRDHCRQSRTGEIVLAHPRISAGRAEAGRRLDQARRLGAGRHRCRISSRAPMRRLQKLIPGIRPVPFGHLGDGNIHYNISQPVGADKDAFLARWYEVNAVVHDVVQVSAARSRRNTASA